MRNLPFQKEEGRFPIGTTKDSSCNASLLRSTDRVNFCHSRGLLQCVKKWGLKKEESLSRVPQAPQCVVDISHRDLAVLQYTYSDTFEDSQNKCIGRLFKRFAVAFGLSIRNLSLRYAMLAFTAPTMPLKNNGIISYRAFS